jgi:hypothetical protein
MSDVPIYVAVITAGAGIIGAAIPQVSILARDVRQAERDRRERRTDAWRQACLDLLRASGELRTQVANNAEYHGDEMGARLAEVRKCAASAQLHAVSVAFLGPATLKEPAERLAAAANGLAEAAAQNTDLSLGNMVRTPDFAQLDEAIAAFRAIAAATDADG